MKRIALRFLSSSRHKIGEARAMLAPLGVDIVPVDWKIEELQTQDTEKLVRDKALKAFRYLGRPLFVEHTGLYLDYLGGFPGGLTQLFWDTVGPERFSELFGSTANTAAAARTVIAHVDGRSIRLFEGEVTGRISPAPRGNHGFAWDCVFIPEGHERTFAEMGEEKNRLSMRSRAMEAFAAFLREHEGK